MENAKFVLNILSTMFSAGCFGVLLRLAVQWNTVKERVDILWLHYCKEHQIPYRPIGRKFEEN